MADRREIFEQGGWVTAVESGRYAVELSTRFDNTATGPINGGYSVAACVQALAAALPHPDPLVVTASYLRPAFAGPAEIAVEVARTGRRVSVGEARLLQRGVEVLRVVATFADLGATADRLAVTAFTDSPPQLPPVEECEVRLWSTDTPLSGLAGRTELRFRQGEPAPGPDMTSEFWIRPAGGADVDVYALPALVDMAIPMVFGIGEFATTTIELTVHVRARPAPGWLAARARTRFVMGGYHDEDVELWDSAGCLVAQSRQLQLLPPG
jgi:acyl-coenzyme A thioesterase PaaI-like protein